MIKKHICVEPSFFAAADVLETPLVYEDGNACFYANPAFVGQFSGAVGMMPQSGEGFKRILEWLNSQACDSQDFERQVGVTRSGIAKHDFAVLLLNGSSLDISYRRLKDGALWLFLNTTSEHRTARNLDAQRLRTIEENRLQSLGKMAAGIAHEINNPLGVIKAQAAYLSSLARTKKLDGEAVSTATQLVAKLTDRISGIVKGMALLAHGSHDDEVDLVSVESALQDAIDLCGSHMKHQGIQIRINNLENSFVRARSTQLSQIFYNLLINAAAAIERQEQRWIQIEGERRGNDFFVFVTDSGNGIDGEFQARIFEPFFTTKKVGMGLGLGLSISKALMQSFGGDLRLDPACVNTRFVLRFSHDQNTAKRKPSDEPS